MPNPIPVSGRAPARRCAALALALTLLAAGSAYGVPPVIQPGETVELGDFEEWGGSCDTFLVAACLYGEQDGRLTGLGDVANTFSRAELRAYHNHDFEIGASPGSAETVLAAQISGTLDVRGYLAMLGLGHSRAEVLLQVVDITGVAPGVGVPLDPEEGVVVTTHTLTVHEIVGRFQPGVGAEAGGDVGIPHGGSVGIALTASLGLTAQILPIRESVDFGFDVLLRRGHRYRLLLELRGSNKVGGVIGLSIASFHPSRLAPPNLLHPDFWTASLATLNPAGVADLAASKVESGGGFNFPKIETSIGDFGGSFVGVGLAPTVFQQPSLFPLAGQKGVPVDTQGIVDYLDLGSILSPVEEEVSDPGVALPRVSVTLAQDAIEIARNRDLEDAVARCRERVSLYLPLEHGGYLEAVEYVVEGLISQNEAAGLGVRRAPRLLATAREDAGNGHYARAYKNLCRAYDQIMPFGGG